MLASVARGVIFSLGLYDERAALREIKGKCVTAESLANKNVYPTVPMGIKEIGAWRA